ncbi:unnamed protein product, partial [marine sediment metagenome]
GQYGYSPSYIEFWTPVYVQTYDALVFSYNTAYL